MSYRFRTLKWPDVERFYEGMVYQHAWPIQPMLELVQFLATSPYAQTLFPCTSHDLLRIGRVEDFAPGDNELQIQFYGHTQRFKFTYTQRPDDSTPWSRECDAMAWHAVLMRLLYERLQWFHEP